MSDWNFGLGLDKVIVVCGDRVGIRSEYNGGIILLSSILQGVISHSTTTNNTDSEDDDSKVVIELNKSEVKQLHNINELIIMKLLILYIG